MSQSTIKFENVEFYYNRGKPTEFHALKNINFEIEKGDYVAFLGPSGCGKSTILYVMSGIDQASEGKVFAGENEVTILRKREMAIYRQTGIGIIFQNFNLIPSLSVVENVELPLALLGVPKATREKKTTELLERLEIGKLRNRYPAELSGGQQQRVGIARALANDPPIILADEPLGNLDSTNAKNVLAILKELNERDGKTIVMVTHEAWSLRDAKKIFYLQDGAITGMESRQTAENKPGTEETIKVLYPGLSDAEYRAKTIVHLLLRGFPPQETERMEILTAKLIKEEIGVDEFRSELDKPYKEGGVGLWKQRAERVAREIDEGLVEGKMLDSLYRKLNQFPDTPFQEEIDSIFGWIFSEKNLIFNQDQKDALDELISNRIRGIVGKEESVKILNLPVKKGGAGIKINQALRISDRIESLMSHPDE